MQQEKPGDHWIKRIDVVSKKIEPMVIAVEGSADRDMAWMPDGRTILMSAGPRVFAWTPGSEAWVEVFDAAVHSLRTVSRLAVSPKGYAVAIVAAEKPGVETPK